MKTDIVYLRHIIYSIEKIESYATVGKVEFMVTPHWQDAIIRNLEIIGEAVKRLSDNLKNRSSHLTRKCLASLSMEVGRLFSYTFVCWTA